MAEQLNGMQIGNGHLQSSSNKEQNSYLDSTDKETSIIKPQNFKHYFIKKGNDFFLNQISIQQVEYVPSLLENFVLLIQIAHLCATQYFNVGHNRVHMYVGITLFSLGYACITFITLLCGLNVRLYKDVQMVLYNITLIVQLFNIMYYLFWILQLQDQVNSIQWLTFDFTALFLYYFTLRQTIIKNYIQNWFLLIMLIESLILAIFDTEYFNYGAAQIILILITIISFIFIIGHKTPKKEDKQINSRDYVNQEDVLKNFFIKEKTLQQNKKICNNQGEQNRFQTITQGISTLNCADLIDCNFKTNNNCLKEKANKNKKKTRGSIDRNYKFNSNHNFGNKNISQQSLSMSIDGSHSQNNLFSSIVQNNNKNVQKQIKPPFQTDQMIMKESNNFYNNNDLSLVDIPARQNSKMLQSDTNKLQSYLTFNMEKNYGNVLNTSSIKGSPPMNSQKNISINGINNQKTLQTQNLNTCLCNSLNKQQTNIKSTPNFPFLECEKKLTEVAKKQKNQICKNTFLQQIQQVEVADTYPTISLDKDLNIIHHSKNLIDQLSSQNSFIDTIEQQQQFSSNAQQCFDKQIGFINSDSLKVFKTSGNDPQSLEYSAMPFLSQKSIESKALSYLKNRNLSNTQKKTGFLKYSHEAHKKQQQELRYLLDTTYVQIIEFYESDKKKEFIKSFLHHDTIGQKCTSASFNNKQSNINQDKKRHSILDQAHEQFIDSKQKQVKEEGTKFNNKQGNIHLQQRNSFSQSPALQGYRKAAIRSLSSNIHFALNLNSNSTLSNYKLSANELVNETQTNNMHQMANQIPKSFINVTKSDIKNQLDKQQNIQNTIHTLNHIPQDLTYEENSNTKSKLSSPTKVTPALLKQITSQYNQTTKQTKVSPQTLIIPSFQQLRDPSFTSIKQDNLIQQKSQEEFVQNIYQFERPCIMNSLKKIIQNILELESDNESIQKTYRIMKGAQIQLIPNCPSCDSIRNQSKKFTKPKQNNTPRINQKGGIFHLRKLSDNFNCSIKKFNLENISIDIIVNPTKSEKIYSLEKIGEETDHSQNKNEKIRLVFRRDFSASFFENVYFIHSLQEDQNRSKAEVLLVKKLFIDSFQSVSHEFGTALNCINNLSEVALSKMDQEIGEQLIKPIRYNSAVIQYLINDILDHHMILQNTFVLQIEKFNLLKFKEEIIELFRLQIEYKKLSFDFQIDSQIPEFIYQDKHRIQSILITMIRNAIKYTQNGSIIIELKMQAVYSNNPTTPKTEKCHNLNQACYVQKIFLLGIKVKDTGVGLDETESKRLTHLLNYGFSNEQISKNSLGNGVGGLCVSNLIAIKLSGRENLGIQFEKNTQSSSGTVFRFFVECQAFQKQKLTTIKQNPSQFHEALLNHLPTILDNTINENNLIDSSLMHNIPSSSRINSPNDIPLVQKVNSINPFIQIQTSQQVIFVSSQQTQIQQAGSANLAKNNIYQASMTMSQNLFTMNQNQQSGLSSAHYSQNPNSNMNIQPVQQIPINQISQQAPNSANSSFNNINYNYQSLNYFEQQTEEYQVENLFKNMLFLRAGGGSGSQNQQQQVNYEEQEINESQVGTPLTHNQLAGSVSPLQFICGKRSHFTLIPKTPQNRQSVVEQNSKNHFNTLNRQSISNSQKNFTQQIQITQQNQNITNQNISSINSELNDFQQVTSQRKVIDASKNHIQDPISLASIKQESLKQEQVEDKLPNPKQIQPSSRLDSLRPKTQLSIKHNETVNSPNFNISINFFSNYENLPEYQKVPSENQDAISKRQSNAKRQSSSSVNNNTNSFVSRNTRMTFGAQEDQSLLLNRERSQFGSDAPTQNQSSQRLHNNSLQPLNTVQQVSQEKQNESNTAQAQPKNQEVGRQNSLNKNSLKIDLKYDNEIREESDSKIENSTESCLNMQNSLQYDIADERLENEKPNMVGEFNIFNEKLSTSVKLSSPCCVKVLCVDDEPFNHFVMKQILKTKQINCDTALDGEDGLQKFKQKKKCLSCGLNSYSLILMDLNMPIKNGFEATYEIKQYSKQHQMSKVVIVTCSAFIDIPSKIKAQQSGSDFFIQKPINQQILFNLLQEQFSI